MKKLLVLLLLLFNHNHIYASPEVIAELSQGGKLVFIRHALAPGGGDPENFDLNDCSTQRNLDSFGILQAKKLENFLKIIKFR